MKCTECGKEFSQYYYGERDECKSIKIKIKHDESVKIVIKY